MTVKKPSLADLNKALASNVEPPKPATPDEWNKFDTELGSLHKVSAEIQTLQKQEKELKDAVRKFVVEHGKKEKIGLGLKDDAKLIRNGWMIHNQAAVRRTRDEEMILSYLSKNNPEAVREVRRVEVDWGQYELLKARGMIPSDILSQFEKEAVTYRLMKRNVGKSVCGATQDDGSTCNQEVNTSDKFCRGCGAKLTQAQIKQAEKVEAAIAKAEKDDTEDSAPTRRIMASIED